MADLLTKALLELLWLEVLYHLSSELLEVIDELAECLDNVAFEVSKVYEYTEFL